MLDVVVSYVDGQETRASLEDWPTMRADGIDSVTIVDGDLSVRYASASLYWCYPEGDEWVSGCASVGYDPNPIREVIGTSREREVKYLPDLRHDQVKLGWWWPGTDGPV